MVSSSQRRGGGGGARLGNVIEEEAVGDRQFYDPDQPPEIRRVVRKGLRDLGRKVHGTD